MEAKSACMYCEKREYVSMMDSGQRHQYRKGTEPLDNVCEDGCVNDDATM